MNYRKTRPSPWLRFATFTVCGAKGDFSATRGGEIVDYENVSFDNLADKYYYTSDDRHVPIVDHQALMTDARQVQLLRDASTSVRISADETTAMYAITGSGREICDAAHIIYRGAKGASLYKPLPFSLEDDVDINCVENGVLLRKDLHASFGMVGIVFLKTLNFAMYMKPPTRCDPVLPRDVQADWHDEVRPPPSILLDFMYEAAVVNRWRCDHLRDMLEQRF
ncbi:hypothetical protein J3R83DRAFT_7322 [Lanmaoa asiatica]|nr:hypothetical protein J3R83DRAFT_7322 [Lanmaoa asiatica]